MESLRSEVSLPCFSFDHWSILDRFPYQIIKINIGFQVNRKLIKEQDTWRNKAKEIEERYIQDVCFVKMFYINNHSSSIIIED